MNYEWISSHVDDLNSKNYLLLKAAEQQLQTTAYDDAPSGNCTISLKLINYHNMKKYLQNKQDFVKFPTQANPRNISNTTTTCQIVQIPQINQQQIFQTQLPQPPQQPQQTGAQFVTANNMVPMVAKKRFQPPTKTSAKIPQQTTLQANQGMPQMEDAIVQRIEQDIIEMQDRPTLWSDIVGLDHVRDQVVEIALWPLENPKLFEGIIAPGSGLLLYGPPGTGKTMIGRAIASEGRATFFSIKASTLTSKYVGEGEKTVRALFQLAVQRQPSVIFFDEVDSLLCARSEKDNETSRQIKTEFMVQLEGASRGGGDRVVFVGATNRPQELDDAILRRFQKKIYIPLPNREGRLAYFKNLVAKEQREGKVINLNEEEISELVENTRGYSGADIRNLCREGCMYAVREAARKYDIRELTVDQIRGTTLDDFRKALQIVKPTVNREDLKGYLAWNQKFGSYNYDPEQLDT